MDNNANNPIHVHTPLGTLVVTANTDDEYPGILVDLRRPAFDHDAPIALIEFTNSETDFEGEGRIITRIWGNVSQDDYSDRVVHVGLDDFFLLTN